MRQQAEWSIYVLDCGARLYTGIALDPEARFRAHRTSSRGARFTRAFPPRAIVYQAVIGSRRLALRVEARFKQLSRSRKLDLIASQPSAAALLDHLGL